MPKVVDNPAGPGFKGRQLVGGAGQGKRQAAAGGNPAQQHIGQGVAPFLAWIPKQQQARHRIVPLPGQQSAAPHQHHHGAGIGGGHVADQGHLVGEQTQIGAIAGGKIAPLARRTLAGDAGDQLGHGFPERQQAAGAQRLQQPLGRRHQLQDRPDVSRVDVLALKAPIEADHHHRRLRAGSQGRCSQLILAAVVVDAQLGIGLPEALQGGHHAFG